jgi:hypothetical protein
MPIARPPLFLQDARIELAGVEHPESRVVAARPQAALPVELEVMSGNPFTARPVRTVLMPPSGEIP